MIGQSDGSFSVQNIDYVVATVSAIIGLAVGAFGMVKRRGRTEGSTDQRLKGIEDSHEALKGAHEEHVKSIRAEINRLDERASVIKDQFFEIKSTMATRMELATLSTMMQSGFAMISQRIDNAFHPQK